MLADVDTRETRTLHDATGAIHARRILPRMEPLGYLLAGQAGELQRLRLQSLVWEPAGRTLLEQLAVDDAGPRRAVDIGCGAMGWLRLLDDWVGAGGHALGTDTDEHLLQAARQLIDETPLAHTALRRDDLFESELRDAAFDLVHARFQLAPLGRVDAQLALYRRLVHGGGWVVLEEPDAASWSVQPRGEHSARLIELILAGFEAAGGDFDAGRTLAGRVEHAWGSAPQRVERHALTLPPGHPYLRLPLQFAQSLALRLQALVGREALCALLRGAETELDDAAACGTTFTLVQVAWRAPRGARGG
jgi:SAM-dependent methyltransferase